MMDSLTRVAMAQREIGLSVGEPPATRGYPPSTFSVLARLLERAGTAETGSVTGIYTVLVDGDDHNEPIADAARSILDGHVVLDRKLAVTGHFPSVDVLGSVSRRGLQGQSPAAPRRRRHPAPGPRGPQGGAGPDRRRAPTRPGPTRWWTPRWHHEDDDQRVPAAARWTTDARRRCLWARDPLDQPGDVGGGHPGVAHHQTGRHRAGGDHGEGGLDVGVAKVACVGPDEHVERQIAARRADAVRGPERRGVARDAQVRRDRARLLRQAGLINPVYREPVADGRQPSTWLTVTMPVPPMPARNTSPAAARSTSGTDGGSGRWGWAVDPDAASTVTNEGQSPARHE